MGAPDPDGVDIDIRDGRAVVLIEVWRCAQCGDPIPTFKRTNARYCSTRC